MPSHLTIIRASDFLVATPHGQVDFERSKRILLKIAAASASLVAHEILLDVRDAQIELSAGDLWYLAAELGYPHMPFRGKIAVLCSLAGSDQADFFALCAQNRGFRVRAFTSFEEAVEWLIADGSHLLEHIG
jgi:hypothetical protein